MIIKRYVASTMKEALNKIGEDLGRDAVIISQRTIKKPGFKGWFASKVVEVTAAVESTNISTREEVDNIVEPKYSVDRELKKEVEDMKELLSNIINENKNSHKANNSSDEIKDTINDQKDKVDILKFLLDLDIEQEIAEKILNNIPENLTLRNNKEEIIEYLKEVLGEIVKVKYEEMKGTVALIGPTGVGKTTTIAKIAGNLALVHKKKVGLITVDTYRIGAVEQLRTYADIMNIPFKVVFSLNEMEDAIKSMDGCDVILVDTTGRSSKNTMQLSELRAFLNKAKADSTYLVVSATTKNKDIDIIVQGFSFIEYNNIIITKLDETCTYGSIVNICYKAKAPIGFFTTGQNVPDDIKVYELEEITSLIMGEKNLC